MPFTRSMRIQHRETSTKTIFDCGGEGCFLVFFTCFEIGFGRGVGVKWIKNGARFLIEIGKGAGGAAELNIHI